MINIQEIQNRIEKADILQSTHHIIDDCYVDTMILYPTTESINEELVKDIFSVVKALITATQKRPISHIITQFNIYYVTRKTIFVDIKLLDDEVIKRRVFGSKFTNINCLKKFFIALSSKWDKQIILNVKN